MRLRARRTAGVVLSDSTSSATTSASSMGKATHHVSTASSGPSTAVRVEPTRAHTPVADVRVLTEGPTNLTTVSQEIRDSAADLTHAISEIKNALQESIDKASQILIRGDHSRATFTNSVSQSTADVISINTGNHNATANRVASPGISITSAAATGPPNPNASQSTSPSTLTGVSQVIYLQQPVPPTYRNANAHVLSPSRFLRELEQYFKNARIPPTQQLEVTLGTLQGTARNWAQLYAPGWQNYGDFRKAFLKHFFSEVEQEGIRRKIYTGKWDSRYKMVDHFAYYVHKASLLTKPFSETELLTCLIRHFDIHTQSLWALRGEHTLANAAEFLRSQQEIVDFSNLPPLLPLPNAKTARAPQFRVRPQHGRDQVVPRDFSYENKGRVHQTYHMQKYDYPTHAPDGHNHRQQDAANLTTYERTAGNF